MGEVLIVPARSRVQAHFGRWRSRWGDMTADSFRRAAALSLGSADTGVGWAEAGDFVPAAGQGYWQVLNGAGRAQSTVPAGNFVVASMPTPSSTAHIRALCRFTRFVPGFLAIEQGIFFRSPDGLQGDYWAYCGAGFYRHGAISFTTMPATIAVTATVAGPVWVMGETHVLGVDAVAGVQTFTIDGATLTTGAVADAGNTRHGVFVMSSTVPGLPCDFTRYRCVVV